jgi:hypothetical protein
LQIALNGAADVNVNDCAATFVSGHLTATGTRLRRNW